MLTLTRSRAQQVILAAFVVFMASLWLLSMPNAETRSYIILAVLVTGVAGMIHLTDIAEPAMAVIKRADANMPRRA
jgi:hypothetical protein